MRSTFLPVCFLLCAPVLAQTPLEPTWVRTWSFGQGDGFVSPPAADNHVAVDPVSGEIRLTVDDEFELASPRWDILYTTAPDGTDLTPLPAPMLGSIPAGEFPANMESTVDLAAWDGDVLQASERSVGIGSGTVGSGCIVRADGSRWRMGFGNAFPTYSNSRVVADADGSVWIRSLDGAIGAMHGVDAQGWLRWTKPYAPLTPFNEAVLLGNQVHACRGGIVRVAARANGAPQGSYTIHTGGSTFTQLATDGANIFFAYTDGANIMLGARTTAGSELWSFGMESDYVPTELKASATGHAWLTCNSSTGEGPGMLIVVNPDGMAQWFTYGASMNDLDLDAEQAYITGRSNLSSSETYLIAVQQDQVTGVRIEAASTQLSIFPQPASDVLNVRLDRTVLAVQVMDARGRVVHEQTGNTGTLNVSALANGTYVLALRTADGLLRRPFVVAR